MTEWQIYTFVQVLLSANTFRWYLNSFLLCTCCRRMQIFISSAMPRPLHANLKPWLIRGIRFILISFNPQFWRESSYLCHLEPIWQTQKQTQTDTHRSDLKLIEVLCGETWRSAAFDDWRVFVSVLLRRISLRKSRCAPQRPLEDTLDAALVWRGATWRPFGELQHLISNSRPKLLFLLLYLLVIVMIHWLI